MRYDREYGYGREFHDRGGHRERWDRGEYGPEYEAPWRGAGGRGGGFRMGYGGGALRSRGSWQEGARQGVQGTFEWGDGYVGGRGYGGTNFDYEHGYRTGGLRPRTPEPGTGGESSRGGDPDAAPERGGTRAATRGGYEWGEEVSRLTGEPFGPARYGLGPYYQRLHTRTRDDDDIQEEVEETLFYDTWVDAEAITVRVEDGIVTLQGTLPNYEEIRFATEDAWDVDGVRGVRTELRVEGQPRRSGRASARAQAQEEERGESRDDRGGEARGKSRGGRQGGEGGAGGETPAAGPRDDEPSDAGRARPRRSRTAGSPAAATGDTAAKSGRAGSRGGGGASAPDMAAGGRASNATEGRGEASGGREQKRSGGR
jgi:hypothetical protein